MNLRNFVRPAHWDTQSGRVCGEVNEKSLLAALAQPPEPGEAIPPWYAGRFRPATEIEDILSIDLHVAVILESTAFPMWDERDIQVNAKSSLQKVLKLAGNQNSRRRARFGDMPIVGVVVEAARPYREIRQTFFRELASYPPLLKWLGANGLRLRARPLDEDSAARALKAILVREAGEGLIGSRAQIGRRLDELARCAIGPNLSKDRCRIVRAGANAIRNDQQILGVAGNWSGRAERAVEVCLQRAREALTGDLAAPDAERLVRGIFDAGLADFHARHPALCVEKFRPRFRGAEIQPLAEWRRRRVEHVIAETIAEAERTVPIGAPLAEAVPIAAKVFAIARAKLSLEHVCFKAQKIEPRFLHEAREFLKQRYPSLV
jgi:hypothetical protein